MSFLKQPLFSVARREFVKNTIAVGNNKKKNNYLRGCQQTEYFRKSLIYHSTSDQMLSVVLKPFYAVEITQFYVSDLQDKTCKSFAKIILGLQINAIRNWHWHYA